MASPAKIAQVLPDTLPDDFGDWDSGDSSSTHVDHSGNESAPGSVPKPPAQPAEQQAAVAPVTARLRNVPASATTVREDDRALLRRLRPVNSVVDRLPGTPSPRQANASAVIDEPAVAPQRPNGASLNGARKTTMVEAAAMSEADEILFQSFHSAGSLAAEPKPAAKKWIIVGAASGGAVLLLLLLIIPLANRGKSADARAAVEAQPVITEAQPDAAAPKPSPETLTHSASDKHTSAADTADQPEDTPAAADQDAANTPSVQPNMMNDQLAAPARIPHNLNAQPTEDAPPSAPFGTAGMAGLSGNSAMGSVFNGQGGPKVQATAPKIVNVSAGVAIGLLVQKTTPAYPTIAKSARVSGAVIMHATISKTGRIENLRVVSGPLMLRDAAVDAVKTWRYRPYKLNNEPTEIETTIDVIFSLAG